MLKKIGTIGVFVFVIYLNTVCPQYVKKISIRDCLVEALKYNLDIEIEKYRIGIAQHEIIIQEGAFDPLLTAHALYQNAQSAQVQQFQINDNVIEDVFEQQTELVNYSLGVSKRYTLGGTIGVFHNFDYSKNAFDGEKRDSVFNYETELRATQSLLRNFGIDSNTAAIDIANNNLKNAKHANIDKVLLIFSRVQLAYFDLVNAKKNFQLQQQALDISKSLYEITLSRIRAGTLPETDIAEAERDIAEKTDSLLVATKNVLNAEDRLKKLMRPLDIQFYQNVQFAPIDHITMKQVTPKFADAVKKALEQRFDVKQSLNRLKNANIDIGIQKNKLLPKLDLTASFGFQGQAINHADATKLWYQFDEPSWGVQLSLEIPIGNRVAQSRYKKAALKKKVLITQHKNLESNVIWEIRTAIRTLDIALQRVSTAQKVRTTAQRQLATEKSKYHSGLIPLFQVQNTERRLTIAKMNEINATIRYQKAIVQLETSQADLILWSQRYDIKLPFNLK